MSIEAEIQTEVDALRGRFSDPKALYREVCTLLFFRYGITPTASKLYQLVRVGSMSAPTDAVARFWDELRSKAGVIEIDHPELPAALKDTAAQAVAQIWREATLRAREEANAVRAEMQMAVEQAQIEQGRSRRAEEDATAEAAALKGLLAAAQDDARRQQADLEAQRQLLAETLLRVQELQQRLEEAQAAHERLRTEFNHQLAKAREEVVTANARAEAAERRALMEAEHATQARVAADRQIDALRAQLAQADAMVELRAQLEVAQPLDEEDTPTVLAGLDSPLGTLRGLHERITPLTSAEHPAPLLSGGTALPQQPT
jgi:hypothetical protein